VNGTSATPAGSPEADKVLPVPFHSCRASVESANLVMEKRSLANIVLEYILENAMLRLLNPIQSTSVSALFFPLL